MLHIFYGNDTVGVREKAQGFVGFHEKDGVTVERIDIDTYSEGVLADISGATSLFGTQTLYIIDTPSIKKDFYNDVIEHLESFAQSVNKFVVIETSLLAPQKKKFSKHAESIEEIKGEKKERFNAFAMADALSQKDKRTLWLKLQDAKAEGLSPEEIIGTLWWQLKSLRLSQLASSSADAGMKDFTYNKAKRSISKFKEGELEKLSHSLLTVYHDGHLGKVDIDVALERWTLTM